MSRLAEAPRSVDARPVRVAVIADLLTERWPSMDLVADMLAVHAERTASGVETALVRPAFGRARQSTAERIVHRFWSYPRWVRRMAPADVYHVVDHSYAHLVAELPADRTVVTCHDTDAFRALVTSGRSESNLPRTLVRRVFTGLRRAAAVVCVSEVTRQELVALDLVPADRTLVVPNGVHPSCTPVGDSATDAVARALTGDQGGADLLHVGSTIPRKRIDTLLEVVAEVRKSRPDVRLWRVGGAFTPEQARQVRTLGLESHITVLPFVSRPVLAALYRRAALVLLPSAREGFGLPVIEALACGTPIVCSDLPVLREVGGAAAEYAPVGDPVAWAARVSALLDERAGRPETWMARRSSGLSHAAGFTWARAAEAMARVYAGVAPGARL